ncbi:MAG TPA: hypothetical protein VJ842_10700 [Pyrinomonadaceae bacterium]|nr:hypothetical protein [Pyrinomonadaceae bacterium]
MHTHKQYVLAVTLGVSIGLALYAISYAQIQHANQDSPQKKEVVTSVPEVVSCVKNIKVLNKGFKDAGSPSATITVEVENTSEVDIIAISMESIKGKESYGVLTSSFESDEQLAVIKPHSTATLTMEVSNAFPHVPLQIGSVMYADGTQEGCASSLKNMRDSKAMHEAKKAERKGSPK